MAKRIADEDMVLNIIINGDKGRAELIRLERSVKDLTIANEGLAAKKAKVEQRMLKLAAAGEKDSVTYKNLETEVRQLSAAMERNQNAIDQARQRMATLRGGLELTKMTVADLRSEIARLTKLKNTSVPGTEQWKAYDRQLAKVVRRYEELKAEGANTKGVLCKMADGVNKYWNLVVSGLASFAGVFLGIKGAVNKFLGFTDVLADTRKTTQLTQQEVEELNVSLGKIDTRSPQEELLGLGRIAGKLGIEGKDNIEGFVRAADQINIALKEDLGNNTEEAINHVGKLVDIFKISDNYGIEKGMLKVGSVINELGAASTANEGYIVEFSKRVAGVAPTAGVSIEATMGLAATLDKLGQQAEASSTVYAQMMSKMFKNTAIYADIAGMSLADFSELIKSDANEAFIRVLEGLKGNNAGMEALVRNLGDMQLNGVRATTILGTLASNTATLREQQNLANKAFREGTSLTNEANIKNNNAAALDAKRRKERERLIVDLGGKLQPIMVANNNIMNTGLKILNTLVGFLVDHGAMLLKTTALIAAYTGGMKLATLANNLHLTSIAGVIANLKRLFQTLTLSTWGIALAAVTALGYGLYKLFTYSTDAEKALKRVSDANKEFEKSAASEQITIDRLFGKLKAATEGTKEWGAARKAITDKYGQYLSDMGIEINSLQDVEKAYRAVSAAARQAAKDRAMEKASATAGDEYVNVEVEQLARIREILLKDYGDYEGSALFEDLKKEILSGKELSVAMQKMVADSQKTKNWMGYLYEENDVKDAISKIREAKAAFEVEMKEINSVFGVTSMGGGTLGFRDFDKELSDLEDSYKKKEITKEEHERKLDAIEVDRMRDRLMKEGIMGDERIQLERNISEKIEEIRQKATKGVYGTKIEKTKVTSGEDSAPDYDAKIIALKESYAAEKVTKEEYEKQLDDLELAHLQYRLKNFEGDEEKRLELEQKIADKKISIREKQDKEEKAKEKDKSQEYITSLLSENDELSRKETVAYHERLKKAGLFGKDRKEFTEDELKALEILQKQHADNLKKIEDDARKKRGEAYVKEISDRLKNQETGNSMELAQLQIKHNNELARENIRVSERKEIAKRQAKEMLELKEEQAKEMLDLLNELFISAEADELNLEEQILTEEQKQNIEKRILELQKLLSELALEMPKDGDSPDNSVDLLGMTAEKWTEFLQHLQDGEFGIEGLIAAVRVLQSVWGTFDKIKTAQEKKELKRYEQKTKREKTALDKQLDAGKISQEQYNARVSQLDADLDAKKEAIEKKQAKRKQAMSIIDSIINTAVGVTAALTTRPTWLGIALAATVGSLGAIETALIASQQYAKGKYPVIGADDGMTYQADYAGDNLQTGIYQNPTLGLFSEKEPEMVVDGATTRRLVFDYPQIYQSIMDVAHGRTPQYDSGKYPPANSSVSTDPDVVYAADPEMKQLLRKNLEMMEELKEMDIVISMFGRNGLMKAIKKANKFKQDTTY